MNPLHYANQFRIPLSQAEGLSPEPVNSYQFDARVDGDELVLNTVHTDDVGAAESLIDERYAKRAAADLSRRDELTRQVNALENPEPESRSMEGYRKLAAEKPRRETRLQELKPKADAARQAEKSLLKDILAFFNG